MKIPIIKIDQLLDALDVYHKITSSNSEMVILDFSEATFIRNNFLSIIGLAIEEIIIKNKKYQIIEPNTEKVKSAMQRVGFMAHYCNSECKVDQYGTMIQFTKIELGDNNSLFKFYSYFTSRLENRVANLSPKLLNKIAQKIYELFSNVFRHSKSKHGFICSGQFYPNDNKFTFTIVDGGVTIKHNVNSYLETLHEQRRTPLEKILSSNKYTPISGAESIKWSLEERNSTTGEGGLGLSLLKELIIKSKGIMEIISGTGYYCMKDGKINSHDVEKSFQGTIISIELDTDPGTYYYLVGEKNEN